MTLYLGFTNRRRSIRQRSSMGTWAILIAFLHVPVDAESADTCQPGSLNKECSSVYDRTLLQVYDEVSLLQYVATLPRHRQATAIGRSASNESYESDELDESAGSIFGRRRRSDLTQANRRRACGSFKCNNGKTHQWIGDDLYGTNCGQVVGKTNGVIYSPEVIPDASCPSKTEKKRGQRGHKTTVLRRECQVIAANPTSGDLGERLHSDLSCNMSTQDWADGCPRPVPRRKSIAGSVTLVPWNSIEMTGADCPGGKAGDSTKCCTEIYSTEPIVTGILKNWGNQHQFGTRDTPLYYMWTRPHDDQTKGMADSFHIGGMQQGDYTDRLKHICDRCTLIGATDDEQYWNYFYGHNPDQVTAGKTYPGLDVRKAGVEGFKNKFGDKVPIVQTFWNPGYERLRR